MIEARVDTIIRGVECVGGGVSVEELAKRERRVREARSEPRYCENPDCRVLKLTGERQRLRGLNGVIVEKGAYRGVQYSRVCSWCSDVSLEEEEESEEEKKTRCKNGHDIDEVGRNKDKQCKQCKREQNAERERKKREELRAGRSPEGYVLLRGLARIKEERGISYKQLAREAGISYGSIKHWAYLTRSAPTDAAESLAGVLGVTVADLTGEAP